jgi:hypothetical protein
VDIRRSRHQYLVVDGGVVYRSLLQKASSKFLGDLSGEALVPTTTALALGKERIR